MISCHKRRASKYRQFVGLKATLLAISLVTSATWTVLHYLPQNSVESPKEFSFEEDVRLLRHETHRYLTQTKNTGHSVERKLAEKRHVIYVRIPKTGSSTMTFILWRFGLSRNLTFLLPREGAEGNEPKLTRERFYLPDSGQYCDIMANHVLYNDSDFKPHFPPDTVYVSLIREPLNHLTSTLNSLQSQLKLTVSTNGNVVSHFLRQPALYERSSLDSSFTRNPVMFYFGLRKSESGDMARIKQIIQDINTKFTLVLILERFNESLVLLKRMLGWTIRDIIYLKTNVNSYRKSIVTANERARLRTWSMADHLFYDFFSEKLDSLIKQQESFQEEVQIFEKYISWTSDFCENMDKKGEALRIQLSPFNHQFLVTKPDCRLMTMRGLVFLSNIRALQNRTAPKCSTPDVGQ